MLISSTCQVWPVLLQGLSCFVSLTALTQISINTVPLSDEALAGIAACTQIRDLKLVIRADPGSYVTTAGLMYPIHQLCGTQLTGLEHLVVRAVVSNLNFVFRPVSLVMPGWSVPSWCLANTSPSLARTRTCIEEP